MSVGVYNETYFANRPEEKLRDGVFVWCSFSK